MTLWCHDENVPPVGIVAPRTGFSAVPEVQNHRPVLLVLVADRGKVNEYRYDLVSGQAVR